MSREISCTFGGACMLYRQVAKRHCFTFYGKMAVVRQIQCNIEVGNLSIRAACKATNLHHKQFITWKIDIVLMQKRLNKKAKSMNVGPPSVLYPIEYQLLHYIFKLRECGMAVTSRSVIIKAAALCREFNDRVPTAQYATTCWFIARNGWVHFMGTRISQQHPRELEVISNGSWDTQWYNATTKEGTNCYMDSCRTSEHFYPNSEECMAP